MSFIGFPIDPELMLQQRWNGLDFCLRYHGCKIWDHENSYFRSYSSLPNGNIKTGGRTKKTSAGYNLTNLFIESGNFEYYY